MCCVLLNALIESTHYAVIILMVLLHDIYIPIGQLSNLGFTKYEIF